ncbi:MAG TPA: TrkH family potassium uptake protein, partial [Microlunatus sp.]|nr:TrkH family potassium uptake protein [Microlunatus sp.]
FRHPGRAIGLGFASAIASGTLLLSLPVARSEGSRAPLLDAVFTATSAVCVTGLIVVDTETYWSDVGQVVILILIQLGGLGLMTVATLLAILFARRLGLQARLLAQAETKAVTAADLRRVVRNIVLFTLVTEAIAATVLAARFMITYGESPAHALWSGVFHAVSAFNNAGFSLYADSLMRYVTDPWVNAVVASTVIIGGLGFPVIFELARSWRRPRAWSVVTRITVIVSVSLLVLGTLVILAVESGNEATLGALDGADQLQGALFASTVARTAGFNTIDVAALTPESLFAMDVLMFIGGGSAGTAGGIKVTTFGLLAFVLWSEIRGEPDVVVGRRRVPASTQRQAVTVALLGVGLVVSTSFVLQALTPYPFDLVLFETISAFATVGLSTGITDDLPDAGQVILVILMFVGRLGPLTLASALAMRDRHRPYRLPEERIIVG